MANKYHILLTDDHPVFRNGLKNILRKTNYFDKIFEASNGTEAMKIVEEEEIDIIMMDIEMEGMNGIEATRNILAMKPEIKVVTLTMFCDPKKIYEMCKSGVKGYLLKDANPREITKAVSMILDNEEYYSPRVQSILANVYRDFDHSLPEYDQDHQITKAQTDVLKLLCKQYSSEEIAAELEISTKTVHRHRHDLLIRTESINLAGLVIYAMEHGILKVNMKPE